MADLEVVVRVRVASVERLVCHPRLPFLAAVDSERPAVHVLSSELRECGTTGAASDVHAEAFGWDRTLRTPALAWHPTEPLLVVASEGALVQWTPAGFSPLDGLTGAYRSLAFDPSGQRLWASPSSDDGDNAWDRSDIVDLATRAVGTGPRWDTGIAEHPAGGLVARLCSDQGATLVLFGQVDQEGALRTRRRALILDADGYQTPVFSADGRYLAVRGNAYDNSLEVFGFPSLRHVLATILGEPNPGFPYPQEWLDQLRAWSRHNITFAAQPGVLWIGRPDGVLVEVDLDNQNAVEHDVLAGSPITAVASTAAGEIVVASGNGEIAVLSVIGSAAAVPDRATVLEYLEGTSELPDDGDLDTDLVVSDGDQVWGSDDLTTVTSAAATDPTWLQLTAFINNARDR